MAKEGLDFSSSSELCKHCLMHVVDMKKQSSLSGVCCECSDSLAVGIKTREKLWKHQLKLFLNYQNNEKSTVLLLYSGGTDSTLALYIAKQELKLNVIALMFDFGWERPQINRKADEFCLKYQIPLIRIRIDLKVMFLNHCGNVKKASDKTIINYPWCQLCSVGESSFLWWAMEKVALLLKIERVINGANVAFFNVPIRIIKNAHTKIQHFLNKYNKWFYPSSILTFQSNILKLSLPLACGYNRARKMEKLRKIGFSLPQHYFRTPGSECHLALLLPCAQKLSDSSLIIPKASAYNEFLSGYVTREEWLEQLVMTNNFAKKDLKRAIEFLRNSLLAHTSNNVVSITFNDIFPGKMRYFNKRGFESELIKQIKERVDWWYFGLKKYKKIIKGMHQIIKLENKKESFTPVHLQSRNSL